MKLKVDSKHQEPHLEFKSELESNPRFENWREYLINELTWLTQDGGDMTTWFFLHPDDEDFGGPDEFKTIKLNEIFDYYP